MTAAYKRAIQFCLTVLISLSTLSGQNNSAAEAQEYFDHGNYGSAIVLLKDLLEKEPDNALLNYQAGVCYLHSRSLKHHAVEYFQKAIQFSPSWKTKSRPGPQEAPLDAHKLLGDAYTYAYNFEPAIQAYEKYKELAGEKETDQKLLAEVELRLDLCRHLKHYVPSQSFPISAKSGTPCGELVHGSITGSLSPDKSAMIYTLVVPVDKQLRHHNDTRFFEERPSIPESDSAEKSKATPPRPALERDTVMYASTIGTSLDGQVMLTYKNDSGNATVYISRLRDNLWSAPVPLRKPKNTAGWEPFESLSPDGKFMYFASNRPGGYGGYDLYRCKKQPDGQWSKAENLGAAVNTENDELAPFIHADGVTLYFSSNRVRPGSYDIYAVTTSGPSNWEKPVNVGFPINKDPNDIFQVNADPKKIFAATGSSVNVPDLEKIKSEKKQKTFNPDKDNYLITLSGSHQKNIINLRRGTIADEKGATPLAADISIYDNESGQLLSIYHTSDHKGTFSFLIPQHKNLQVLYESAGMLPVSEHIAPGTDQKVFQEQKAVRLQKPTAGATVTLSNIFFAEHKTEPEMPVSSLELNRLITLLKENPAMKIRLENTIFAPGDKKFYKHLSKARARGVKKELEKNGISKKRLDASGGWKKLVEEEKFTDTKGRKKRRRQPEEKNIQPLQVLTYTITDYKTES